VPSLGQVKVIPRRLAAAEGPEGLPHFPALAARWAASHRGKAYTDQARPWPDICLFDICLFGICVVRRLRCVATSLGYKPACRPLGLICLH
jgi:hypothetical protein